MTDLTIGDLFSSSDHAIITCKVKAFCNIDKCKTVSYNFSKADWEMARAHLALIDWDTFFNDCSSTGEMWSLFKHLINELTYLYVPTDSKYEKNSPWFSSKLRKMKKIKLSKWKKYKNSRANRYLVDYRNYSKIYKKEITESRARYEENRFHNKNTKAKQFFNFIKKSMETRDEVSTLTQNGVIYDSDLEKCEVLSRHYKSMFTIDDQYLPQCEQNMPVDSFTDIEITDFDIVKAIQRMNAGSSPGIDDVFPKFINNVAPYIIKPLRKIFRASLEEGRVPDDWVTSIIIPVYKKNKKPSMCASYRPINLTCCVSKIFERIIYQKLIGYLWENNLISPSQHGFLSKRSTMTNLLACTFDWVTYFNNRQACDIIYIDYEKAFDKVPHCKLLYKLGKLGLGGKLMSWIECFITKRRQCVKVRKSYSQYVDVDSGVAQGTLLGPLLFILYISDITKVIDENSSIILYADDSKIHGRTNTLDKCYQLAQNLNKLEEWCSDWQLSINYDKCEVLRVGRQNLNFQYELGGNVIPSKTYCRDLGVYVGNDLYYRHHYETITRNGHYLCKLIRNSFASQNVDFLVFMYKTYILPKIEYASSVWSPYYKKDVDLIEKVQKKFTKFIPNLFESPYMERLNILKMITLEERRIYLDIILMYKIVHGLVDLEFEKYCRFNTRGTRGHPLKLNVILSSRVNCHKYHFFSRIVKIWNAVPTEIITIEKLAVFKKRIYDFDVKNFCIGRAFV